MATDNYFKINGIDGESTAKGFEKQIEILSCSLGGSAPAMVSAGRGGLSSSRVQLSPITCMAIFDKATPLLFEHMCQGKHIDEAVLSMRKQTGSSQEPYLVYTFRKAMVENVQMSASSGGEDKPMVTFSLVFEEIEISYKIQKKDGKLEEGGTVMWNAATVA